MAMAAGGALLALAALFAVFWPAPVTVSPVIRGKVIDAVYATGTIECERRVDVKAKSSGNVTLHVMEGAAVAKGQLLAEINNPGAGHDLRAVQVDLEEARRDQARIEKLARQGAASESDAETARARTERLAATLDSQATRVSDTKILSPLNGIVLGRSVESGQFISVNEPVYKVGDVSSLIVEVWVDEAEVARIHERGSAAYLPQGGAAGPATSDSPGQESGGSRAAVSMYAFPGRSFLGRVFEVLPDANRDRKAYLTKIRLDDPPEGLRSGMTAEVNVIVGEKPAALLAPADGLENGSVWVVRKGRARRQEVKVGIRDLLRVEVLDGLAEGEPIVVSGFDKLKDGSRVTQTVRAPDQGHLQEAPERPKNPF